MEREKIARLRALVAEAATERPMLEGSLALQPRYDYYAYNMQCLAPPPLEQTPKARAFRALMRAAMHRPWGMSELAKYLDRSGVGSVNDLDLEGLEDALQHLQRWEDCGQTACDWDGDLPAR